MSEQPVITPEVLVPRLGEQLVNMGLLTASQLEQALKHQQRQAAEGKPASLLGQTLVELGFLDRPTLDRAVTEQIIQLRSALEDANRHLEARVKQRTAELQEALRKLSELSELKANFMANVSHELRTPLTHVRGYVELMTSESLGPLTEEQKRALQVSLRSVHRLQNLIDDLILFSQAAQGEMSLQLGPVNLNQLAGLAIDHAQSKANEREITLAFRVAPTLQLVRGDFEKLRWVISQLLDNAIKFTEPGGSVMLVMDVENEIARVTVRDTGIGIKPERMAEVFEPFHQLDGSSTRRYGGTGLGLALVRQIIEAHGSIVSLNSEPGDGTTVSFPLMFFTEDVHDGKTA